MTRTANVLLCFLAWSTVLYAQSPAKNKLSFDLSRIGFVLNGEQICEDKGRLQDYPSKVMDQIIAAGSQSVPELIAMITDERLIHTREPIICYWYGMTIGDAAHCVLADLFTDPDYKVTIPGADWAKWMDAEDKNRPDADQLHLFVKRHGSRVLQVKWRRFWTENKNRVQWDQEEKCFKPKDE